jgi:hypothetical protein
MASLRFATMRDLYEAFPVAQDDVGAEPCDEPALDFLRRLAEEEKWEAALAYCAYLLPRRQAVWWGCQSLRRIQPHRTPKDTAAIEIAEAWVRDPEEQNRRAALDYGTEGDHRAPATWMALAAGWSGGSVVPLEIGVAYAAPYQTARAIRAGLMIAMSYVATDDIPRLMRPCIENGIELSIERPS